MSAIGGTELLEPALRRRRGLDDFGAVDDDDSGALPAGSIATGATTERTSEP